MEWLTKLMFPGSQSSGGEGDSSPGQCWFCGGPPGRSGQCARNASQHGKIHLLFLTKSFFFFLIRLRPNIFLFNWILDLKNQIYSCFILKSRSLGVCWSLSPSVPRSPHMHVVLTVGESRRTRREPTQHKGPSLGIRSAVTYNANLFIFYWSYCLGEIF